MQLRKLSKIIIAQSRWIHFKFSVFLTQRPKINFVYFQKTAWTTSNHARVNHRKALSTLKYRVCNGIAPRPVRLGQADYCTWKDADPQFLAHFVPQIDNFNRVFNWLRNVPKHASGSSGFFDNILKLGSGSGGGPFRRVAPNQVNKDISLIIISISQTEMFIALLIRTTHPDTVTSSIVNGLIAHLFINIHHNKIDLSHSKW